MGIPILEQQTVGALAAYRDDQGHMLAERYPEVDGILEDRFAKSFWKAVTTLVKDNGQPIETKVVPIASAMARDGYPTATPDMVKDVIDLAYRHGAVDVDTNIKVLTSAHNEAAATQELETIAKKLKLRQISVAEALEESQAIGKYVGRDDSEFISTDDWQVKAPQMFSARRAAMKSGKVPTFPVKDLPSLYKIIPYVDLGTLTMIVAQTGVGKSMFARQIAHWWASNHGRSVLYCSTELTNFQQVCRDVAERTGKPIDALLRGDVDDETLGRHLTPYKGGGRVIYWEASGKPLPWVLAEAKKYNADIIYDYADMAEMGGGKNSTRADQFGNWLQELKTYTQHAKACAVVVQQMDKASSMSGKPSLLAAKGSSNFAQRPNYGFLLEFEELAEPQRMKHPWEDRYVEQKQGEINVMGKLRIGKNSFGGGQGRYIDVFRYSEKACLREIKLTEEHL